MFGLNDNNNPDATQMSHPDLVTKSNADLPDGLGSPMPVSTSPIPIPPLAAGPIESILPGAPMPASDKPTPAPLSDPTNTAHQAPSSPLPPLNGSSQDEMLKMKQQALQNLAPLVGHLDQTPEEKFRTTMMLLQASDNPELVKEAYAAANAIQDEKARAQALLDVVNEINYFTQHKQEN
jgi:hypothetical protein